jgi:hypothetical protein
MDDSVIPSLHGRYMSVAIYYEAADMVEYVRRDEPCVYRRIDDFLTLALRMTTRTPIGFRLKGFNNFYIRHLRDEGSSDREDFLKLVAVIEKAIEVFGNRVFDEEETREAYLEARQIAKDDNAALPVPQVAA